MANQAGWKPLPNSLKILFLLLVLKLVWGIFGISGLLKAAVPVEAKGLSLIFELVSIALIALLLLFLWCRFGIAWLYGIAYLALSTIGNFFWAVLAGLLLSKQASEGAGFIGFLRSSMEPLFPEKTLYFLALYYFAQFLLSGIFLLALFLQKDYFESKITEEKVAVAEKALNKENKTSE